MRQAASSAVNCQRSKPRASCGSPQDFAGAWPFERDLGDVNDGRIGDRIDPKRLVEVAFPARQIDDQQLPGTAGKITRLALRFSIAFSHWMKDLKPHKALPACTFFFVLRDLLIQTSQFCFYKVNSRIEELAAAVELCQNGRRLFSDFNRCRCIANGLVEIQHEVWNWGFALVSLPLFKIVMSQGRFEELAKRGADANWRSKIDS